MERHPIMPRIMERSRLTETGCQEWTGYVGPAGYGMLRVDGIPCGAHRAAWVAHHGRIPDGMFVCHHCDNPKCVNIDHLFLGTAADNNWDKIRKGRGGYENRRNPGNRSNHRHGEQLHNARLTDAQVTEIRGRLTGRRGEQKELAAEYGVSPQLLNKVASGKTYAGAS